MNNSYMNNSYMNNSYMNNSCMNNSYMNNSYMNNSYINNSYMNNSYMNNSYMNISYKSSHRSSTPMFHHNNIILDFIFHEFLSDQTEFIICTTVQSSSSSCHPLHLTLQYLRSLVQVLYYLLPAVVAAATEANATTLTANTAKDKLFLVLDCSTYTIYHSVTTYAILGSNVFL